MSAEPSASSDAAATLRRIEAGTTTERALSFFDSLPPVRVEEMIGAWQGSELKTGHRLDGLLENLGWHGKRFEGADSAHPLIFADSRGLFGVNPALVPVTVAVKYSWALRNALVFRLARPALRLLRTQRPKARLRMIEYRGVPTGTMSYDAIPANDHFRKVTENVLVGAMDLRGLTSPFMFVLRRETPASTPAGWPRTAGPLAPGDVAELRLCPSAARPRCDPRIPRVICQAAARLPRRGLLNTSATASTGSMPSPRALTAGRIPQIGPAGPHLARDCPRMRRDRKSLSLHLSGIDILITN